MERVRVDLLSALPRSLRKIIFTFGASHPTAVLIQGREAQGNIVTLWVRRLKIGITNSAPHPRLPERFPALIYHCGAQHIANHELWVDCSITSMRSFSLWQELPEWRQLLEWEQRLLWCEVIHLEYRVSNWNELGLAQKLEELRGLMRRLHLII